MRKLFDSHWHCASCTHLSQQHSGHTAQHWMTMVIIQLTEQFVFSQMLSWPAVITINNFDKRSVLIHAGFRQMPDHYQIVDKCPGLYQRFHSSCATRFDSRLLSLLQFGVLETAIHEHSQVQDNLTEAKPFASKTTNWAGTAEDSPHLWSISTLH